MNAAEAKQRESQVLLPTYDRIPLLLDHGKDVYLYDSEGRKYLDFVSGIGVNALGYGDRAVVKTIAKQSAKLIHCSNLYYHEFTAELAERLAKISGLDRVFLSNSGTEAWEGALRLRARRSIAMPSLRFFPAWNLSRSMTLKI
jgi:acetylornithine/N-succinyldiaminopimelate aminotransferase